MKSLMNNSMKLLTIGASSIVLLAGCSSDTDYNFESSELRQQQLATAPLANYNPSAGVFPIPNSLLFTGSQDGTINIPVPDETDFSNPRVALNTLDGFSTIEPILADFGIGVQGQLAADAPPAELMDAETISIQDTVRVFEVTLGPQGQVTGVVAEVDATQMLATAVPADPTTSANGSQIVLVPLQPLKESTGYLALITNGVKDINGSPLQRGLTYAALAGAADLTGDAGALQGLIRAMLAAASGAGVNTDSVVLSWTFNTQSITSVLRTLKEAAVSSPIALVDTQIDTGALSAASPDLADIFAGQMSIPYYLDIPSQANPVAPLNTFFKNASGEFLTPLDNAPVVKNTLAIPVLMTKPKGEMPAEGWPIAIFQHGIGRSRADLLAIADAMASAGFAVIGIDAPMHGISATDAAAGFRLAGSERNFDVDYVDNATGAPGPDGIADASGTHFYNLSNLLNTRDNTRQGIADLFTLSASVGSIADINPARKVFIGHSLGAIMGTTFLAFDDTVNSASLAMGGGGLPRILANSPAFGPAIAAGLASAGIEVNSADGNAFLNAAQTVVDSVDPVNHAAAAAQNTTVHLMQVNGDTTVINDLTGFPLVGTEPLIRMMGLGPVTETTAGAGAVRFSTGYHGSLLAPTDFDPTDDRDAAASAAVFAEMQMQIAAFAATGNIVITNPAVIAGAAAP